MHADSNGRGPADALRRRPAAQTPSIVEGRHDRHGTPHRRRSSASSPRITRDGAGPLVDWLCRCRRDRSSGDGCWDGRNGAGRAVRPVKLEGSAELFVLYRVDSGAVGRIQIASPECPLDLGGLTLHWLSNVTAAASLDWLATFASTEARGAWPNGAVTRHRAARR